MQRRDFLRWCSSMVAGGSAAFSDVSGISSIEPPDCEGKLPRALVLIELAGGCDALNSLVPHCSALYYRLRPNLAIPRSQVIDLGVGGGLHPALRELKGLYDRGMVSIIWGVGYPDLSSSHFFSREVWRTACLTPTSDQGWLAEIKTPSQSPIVAANVGISTARSRCSPLGEALSFSNPGYETGGRFFSGNLRIIAKLLLQSEVRLFYTCLSGFDTHSRQVEPGWPCEGKHAELLSTLSRGLASFFAQLDRQNVKRQVLLLVYSEFGRSLAENAVLGTAHGASGIVFILGDGVKPGIFGTRSHLIDEETVDIPYTVDFRSVYATILADWLNLDPVEVLSRDFPRVGFL